MTCRAFGWPRIGSDAKREQEIRDAVAAFYSAYSRNFEGANDFAAEDWHHIGPSGGWTRGHAEVLRKVREVHSTYLRDAVDTVEAMSVRFATRSVAIATVTSRSTPFTTPDDGVVHAHDRNIRTFVVVKRRGRWLVVHDQNTLIQG